VTVVAPARPLRVLIADDHEPTRRDIRGILARDPRFDVIAEAADAASAIHLAQARRPDIALLDIGMPGGGLDALWEIAACLPDTRVVMLTVSEAEDDLFAALRAGARGYLLKDMDPRRLPEALHDVWSGAVAYPRPLVARMVKEFRDTTPRRRQLLARDGFGARLTSREWQVLDLLARKQTNAEIAERLVLTQSGVRAHIASVVKKLEVGDRDEAIALFATRPEN